jgi:CBS domain-containing protein
MVCSASTIKENLMPQRPIRRVIENQTILTAPTCTTIVQAAQLMKMARVGAIMVVDGDKLVGIFTERDALFRVLAEGLDLTTPLSQVMTPDPQTIHPDKPFIHALHMMYESGFRHVPVAENGVAVGMVSARDALAMEAEEFEAAVYRREYLMEILA